MVLFEPTDTVFSNETVLQDDYRPRSLEEREAELEEYQGYLQPAINGVQPQNIFLYGKTGVGKTAATKYLLYHLQQDAQKYDVDISTVYLNCEDLPTSYRVAVNLLNDLRPADDQVSQTGHPINTIYQMLWEELDSMGGIVLLVLDEIDYIGDDDSILYQISRARSNEKIEDARIGLIGISNDFKFRDQLDPRVEDTLCERELHFSPYDASQLRNILQTRAERAFKDGSIESGVIELCSAIAAKDKGSARQALDLLLESGYLAQRNGDKQVTTDHVEEAQSLLSKKKIEETIRDLTANDHLTLSALVILSVHEPETIPARRDTVYTKYLKLTDKLGYDSLGERAFHDHLSELVMLGLLNVYKRNKGRKGGVYFEYELDTSLENTLKAIKNILTLGIDIDSLQEEARRKGLF